MTTTPHIYKSFNHNIPTILVLCLALVISVIDGTILNVSINDITRDFNSNIKEIQWVITCYSLVIASLTIFGGRLGDLFGPKKMFILGAIIFAIGSSITAMASDMNYLLLGWSIIEGIGAALMIPASSSLIVANFAPEDRGKAFGIYGASAGIASAIGPILGGFLTTNYSWRWAFGINVIVVAILLVCSTIVKEMDKSLNNPTDQKQKFNLDIVGVILSSISLSSISYGIIQSSIYGWWKTDKIYQFLGQNLDLIGFSITPILIAFGFLFLILFVMWEYFLGLKDGSPLLDLRIFKNKQFTIGILAWGMLMASVTGIFTFGVALFYQKVAGLSAFESGIGLVPMSVTLFVTAPLTSKIAQKITAKYTVLIGLLITTIASSYIYYSLSITADRISFILPLGLFGVGFGLVASQLSSLTLESVDRKNAGVASGIRSTMQEIGKTIGSAVIGAAFVSAILSSFVDSLNVNANIPQDVKNQITQGTKSGNSGDEDKNNFCANTLNILNKELCIIQKTAYVDGSKIAIIYTGAFTFLSFIIVLFLPQKEQKAKDDFIYTTETKNKPDFAKDIDVGDFIQDDYKVGYNATDTIGIQPKIDPQFISTFDSNITRISPSPIYPQPAMSDIEKPKDNYQSSFEPKVVISGTTISGSSNQNNILVTTHNLNTLLSTLIDFGYVYKSYYWNFVGLEFPYYSQLFNKNANLIIESQDKVAQVIRNIDQFTIYDLANYKQLSQIQPNNATIITNLPSILKYLYDQHNITISLIYKTMHHSNNKTNNLKSILEEQEQMIAIIKNCIL